MSNQKAHSEQLTADELAELRDWQNQERFFELPIHAEIEYQLKACMDGIESAILVGPLGVGKSFSVKMLTKRIQQQELADNPEEEPGEVILYEASRANGTKTALTDFLEAGLEQPLSAYTKRSQSPKNLIDRIAEELKERDARLVCIDEAQFIDSDNLDLLRQIPDRAHALEHNVRLFLIGTYGLLDKLSPTGQIGQRFSAKIRFPCFTRREVGPHLPSFHPHLPRLRDSLTKSEWAALEQAIFRASNRKFRRLAVVLENANALAIRFNRRIDREIIEFAIDKLAAEV